MIEVRKICESEIAKVAELEDMCFSDPWSEKSILETYQQNHAVILGGWQQDELVGYVIFYYVLDEGEIARIAVSPARRKEGAATAVFEGLIHLCKEKSVTRILLDVRESNEAAISFYRKMNFSEDGIRKRFYTNPTENAILMSRDVEC